MPLRLARLSQVPIIDRSSFDVLVEAHHCFRAKGGTLVLTGVSPRNPGTGRAAGVIDVALAVTAVHFAATVLHYGSDFDHIAADPQLDATWVVPRGSVD